MALHSTESLTYLKIDFKRVFENTIIISESEHEENVGKMKLLLRLSFTSWVFYLANARDAVK